MMEVPLCGHATVAAAATLLEGEGIQCREFRFQTVHCGVLTVSKADGLYHLSVPLLPPGPPNSSVAEPCDAISKVHSAAPVLLSTFFGQASLPHMTCTWSPGLCAGSA